MKSIIVNHLTKKYGDFEAVKDISFEVEEGSFFAFLGVNGAGKSTTINILSTVLEKTTGDILICGHSLDKEKDAIRKEIGIVFQGSVLDPDLTVSENLLYRASLYGMSSKEAKTKRDEISARLELKDILGRKYKNLSGGQRRRVDIARALIHDPKVLFLDEPTTGLDPQTRKKVWSIINELQKREKLTVFLTTHYMEETTTCDKVVILDSGKIACIGTPHDLKDQYAQDRIIWYCDENDSYASILKEQGLSFKYNKNAYVIKISSSVQATEILTKNKEIMKDYEVIKGNMDDVFLNVTGKAIGE